jgi:hypothetical protein
VKRITLGMKHLFNSDLLILSPRLLLMSKACYDPEKVVGI